MGKYPRTYHFVYSEGTTSDDRISSDVSNLIGNRIIINSKLDGSNSAIEIDGAFGRSHAAYTKNPWDVKLRIFHSGIKYLLDEGVMLFLENMEAIHSLEYTNLESFFYLFGGLQDGVFSSWEDVELWSDILNIPTVPVLFDGIVNSEKELKELVLKLAKEPSTLGAFDTTTGEKMKEGVVVRPYDSFPYEKFGDNIRKYVRANHVKSDEFWVKNWRKAKLKTYGKV